jgi:predicted ester cyclase
MSGDENKALVRRLLEDVWNDRNIEAIDAYYHQDIAEEIRTHHRQFLIAFPDMRSTVEELVEEGDLVAARLVIEGTHQGPFGGLEPTGRKVSFISHRFYRVRDGRVVETLGMQDRLGLQQQLGALPPDTGTIAWGGDRPPTSAR